MEDDRRYRRYGALHGGRKQDGLRVIDQSGGNGDGPRGERLRGREPRGRAVRTRRRWTGMQRDESGMTRMRERVALDQRLSRRNGILGHGPDEGGLANGRGSISTSVRLPEELPSLKASG